MKTIQDLEKEKLQEEINILRARMQKEFGESKPPGRWEKISAFFRKWYAVMLALIAVGGGFWGIFYPVKTYLNEQQKAVQYDINENMIKALEGLEAETKSEKENAILVLSYYDLNAIPILLYKYSILTDESVKQDYIEAISLIYSRNQSGIIKQIIKKMDKSYAFYKKYRMEPKHDQYYTSLENFVDLTRKLDLESGDEKLLKEFYDKKIADLKTFEGWKNEQYVENHVFIKESMEQFTDLAKNKKRFWVWEYIWPSDENQILPNKLETTPEPNESEIAFDSTQVSPDTLATNDDSLMIDQQEGMAVSDSLTVVQDSITFTSP